MRVTLNRVEQDGKITLQESSGLAIVTINRPHYKNAMTVNMWLELADIAKRIPENPKSKVVIIRGSGGLFTAGSDIKEFSRMSVDQVNDAFKAMEEAISAFEALPIPTVALVNGPAAGAGFELALACDLRIGTHKTKIGMPIGRLGITLSKKFIKRIVDLMGPSKTKDLVYTGRLLDVKEAYQWGAVNYVVPVKENPERYVISLAKRIQEQSPASLRAVKEGVAAVNSPMDRLLDDELESYVDSVDFPEGTQAFVEKRKPHF
ncbi:enoyl-CoA hydratase/isomerase family protein [Tuberibacillus sp. Marseille-P3662]|uniref:enoyl-CoA hydratase/isomerase family protein n=1 Tax=Tuberibacillus sp. Marseille-P3662 TaxID=1965358 RepID=UPI000A1CC6C1|nr:enoyl-CoA hydratase-related protein [Tuberibacillus sp. Marseille-P3662]